MKYSIVANAIFIVYSLGAFAERLDIHTHDVVIQKLEMVRNSIKEKKSLISIYIRLGDLYSDRARLKSLMAESSVCTECKSVVSDREKALKFYENVFGQTKKQEQSRILLQIAHLNALNGNLDRAKQVYKSILQNRKKYSGDLIGTAYAGLAEMKYSEADFKGARDLFERALINTKQNRNYILYKLGWCHFNSGDLMGAKRIISDLLLNAKDLNQIHDQKIDEVLKKTASKDLVTFIAHDLVSKAEIKNLIYLSTDPSDQASVKSNLFYLGQECDRLGNKPGALLVWNEVSQLPNLSIEEKLQIQFSRAQINLDQKNYELSLVGFAAFENDFDKYDCDDEIVCNELQMKSRSYVVNWIKKEKVNPSAELLKGLDIFLKYNKTDVELWQWAGHIARAKDLKLMAANYYAQTADEGFAQIGDRSRVESQSKIISKEKSTSEMTEAQKHADVLKLTKLVDNSLSSEIEMSELSLSSDRRKQSYEHYLALMPTGSRRAEVLYQLAYIKYKAGNFKDASTDFFNIVQNEKNITSDLKIKSADLDLDALAMLKNSNEVETHAILYATLLPIKQKEYEDISRKAAVNDAAERFNNASNSASDMKYALAKLNSISLARVNVQERTEILKKKIIIAEKLRDVNAVESYCYELLQIKSLSREDRQFAISRKLWAAEIKLDFKAAYSLARVSELSQYTATQKEFKLALLAELSGFNAAKHYQNIIKQSSDINAKNLARLKLIKSSGAPWATLAKYKNELKRTPQIFVDAIAYSFAHSNSLVELKKYSNLSSLKNYSNFGLLIKLISIDDLNLSNHALANHRLDESSDTRLKKSMAMRFKLLSKLEKRSKSAVATGSFILQAVALEQFQVANEKMYSDLIRLRMPRGLSKSEKNQYASMLNAQAEKYLAVARHLQVELNRVWGESTDYQNLLKSATGDNFVDRSLAKYTFRKLADVSPKNYYDDVKMAIVAAPKIPSLNELNEAEKDVQKDPFDKSNLEHLKKLAELRGATSMVSYLDARLDNLNRESL